MGLTSAYTAALSFVWAPGFVELAPGCLAQIWNNFHATISFVQILWIRLPSSQLTDSTAGGDGKTLGSKLWSAIHSFLPVFQLRSWRTIRFSEQTMSANKRIISEHIFAPNGGYCWSRYEYDTLCGYKIPQGKRISSKSWAGIRVLSQSAVILVLPPFYMLEAREKLILNLVPRTFPFPPSREKTWEWGWLIL